MRLAFISDIHGNANALEAVLEDIEERNIDKVYVLGDICYRGPEPKRSLDIVKSLNTEVIKGNADEWLIRGVRKGEVPEQALNMMNLERDWALTLLDETDINYLKGLPTKMSLEFDGQKIVAFHATPNSLFDVVVPSEEDSIIQESLIIDESADVFIYAHIHKPYIRYIKGKCVINTGSVGMPFDGLAKSSYAIVNIQNGNIHTTIVRVTFDIEQVVSKFQESDYPNKDLMINILKNGELPK
ncbi:metallophosphoesterase family protein [Fredinandcohnia humi]